MSHLTDLANLTTLGSLLLWLAVICAGLSCALLTPRKHPLLSNNLKIAYLLAGIVSVGFIGGFACLIYAFLISDFSVLLVALHSSTLTPWVYKISAAWSNHEGSLLLLLTFMSLFTLILHRQRLPLPFKSHALWSQHSLIFLLGLFLLTTSSSFQCLYPIPLEGKDLNPLLQDLSVICHPPLIFLGMATYGMVFSLTISALFLPKVHSWPALRIWNLWATAFTGVGITLGSFWAFYELGWGGWWFWDPVENASLLPWLIGIALMHSGHVKSQTEVTSRWTLFLGLLTFTLCLVGTLLVRSGLVSSVHAFADNPERGYVLASLIVIIVGGGFSLFSLSSVSMASHQNDPLPRFFTLWNFRNSGLILQTLLFALAAALLLLSVFYPNVVALLGGTPLSLGPHFYEATVLPLLFPTFILVGLIPCLPSPMVHPLSSYLEKPVLLGVTIAGSSVWLLWWMAPPPISWMSWVGIAFGMWILTTVGHQGWRLLMAWHRKPSQEHPPVTTLLPMHLAHMGLGILVLSIAIERGWHKEWVAPLMPGSVFPISENIFLSASFPPSYEEKNFVATPTQLHLSIGPTQLSLQPEERWYIPAHKATHESDFVTHHGITYTVTLGESVLTSALPGSEKETQKSQETIQAVRLSQHPALLGIWLGGLLMGLGIVLAARKRLKSY